mmetsp:Transcript_15879/g.53510  ORF Transcript_15879/g.53510 Transcript_15879/m.53510 type:complete len:219 (-) Transcript_15879:282-938(-)
MRSCSCSILSRTWPTSSAAVATSPRSAASPDLVPPLVPAPSSMKTVRMPSDPQTRIFFMESSNMTHSSASAPTALRTVSNAAASGLHAGITSSTAKMSSSLKYSRTASDSRHRRPYSRGALVKTTSRSPASSRNDLSCFANARFGGRNFANSQCSAQYSPSMCCWKGFGSLPSAVATERPFNVEWYFLKYSSRTCSANSCDAKPSVSTIKSATMAPLR